MKFTTKTGSVYTLDRGTMGWHRVSTAESGRIRQEFGTLLDWPDIEVGSGAVLNDSKIRSGAAGHFVMTSPVVSIEDADV